MNKKVLDKIFNVKKERLEEKLRCTKDSKLKVKCKTTLTINMKNKRREISFIIVENMNPPIIDDMDLHKRLEFQLPWKKQKRNQLQPKKTTSSN